MISFELADLFGLFDDVAGEDFLGEVDGVGGFGKIPVRVFPAGKVHDTLDGVDGGSVGDGLVEEVFCCGDDGLGIVFCDGGDLGNHIFGVGAHIVKAKGVQANHDEDGNYKEDDGLFDDAEECEENQRGGGEKNQLNNRDRETPIVISWM